MTESPIRRLALFASAFALILSACAPGKSQSAWNRWGITRSDEGRAAQGRFAAAHRLLYDLEFSRAESAYAALAQEFPGSAEAHLGYAMALRYGGKAEPALEQCRRALELDSAAVAALNCYGDLVSPLRSLPNDPRSSEERFADAEKHYRKALASEHPMAVHAHTGLWAIYIGDGRLTQARAELAGLGQAGYYPPPLADHARNLLVALEPDAVLFTNGDNDTYPLLVLQEHEALRRDVRVINLALLNVTTYQRLMRDSLGVPVSLDDAALAAIVASKRPDGSVELPADRLAADIIATGAQRGVPVYFATTADPARTAPWHDRLVFEGLVWRVASGPAPDTVDEAAIEANLGKFRLDNIGSQPDWPVNISPLTRSVRPLAVNYAVACAALARHYSAAGDSAQTLAWCRKMADFCRRTREERFIEMARGIWLELMPGNAEAENLKV